MSFHASVPYVKMIIHTLLSANFFRLYTQTRTGQQTTYIKYTSNPKKQPSNCHSDEYRHTCEHSKINKLICKCNEHSDIQQCLLCNYNPDLGKRNLTIYAQHKWQKKISKPQSNS